MNLRLSDILVGSSAGVLATFPMTGIMKALHRKLPPQDQYPLPPRQITMNLLKKVGPTGDVPASLDEGERTRLTLLGHFAYGAFSGAVYSQLTPRMKLHPIYSGIVFGLLVWIGSYAGLLPALRILKPAAQQPKRRNELMIFSHVVWGATLGLLFRSFQVFRRFT